MGFLVCGYHIICNNNACLTTYYTGVSVTLFYFYNMIFIFCVQFIIRYTLICFWTIHTDLLKNKKITPMTISDLQKLIKFLLTIIITIPFHVWSSGLPAIYMLCIRRDVWLWPLDFHHNQQFWGVCVRQPKRIELDFAMINQTVVYPLLLFSPLMFILSNISTSVMPCFLIHSCQHMYYW